MTIRRLEKYGQRVARPLVSVVLCASGTVMCGVAHIWCVVDVAQVCYADHLTCCGSDMLRG